MNHIVTWAEIPANNLQRAMDFYQEVLGLKFKCETMDGFEMALIESENETVSGALIAGKGCTPSMDGSVVYLNGGDDLAKPLKTIEKLGCEVLIPKTAIHDGECGFFAQFVDPEGNRVGLWSMK